MDPYLEGPLLWRDVHSRLISEIQEALNLQFDDRYVARIEERVYISDIFDAGRQAIIPDVHLARTRAPGVGPSAHPASAGADDAETAVEVIEVLDEEIRESFLEIIDVRDRAVVTVLEVLSPTNKIAGARGREDYLAKRAQVLKSRTNLVEIDLLRGGEPVFVGQALPRHDYMVVHSRFTDARRRVLVWPILLRQRLPVVPIPLRAPDADVPLDLQAVFAQSYDRGKYRTDIDYRDEPDVRLSFDAGKWADELLRSKGLRTKQG
jgi:hypothetical protein